MKRAPKQPLPGDSHAPAEGADAILRIKIWLTGISPVVWRRVLVPSSFTLRELHGVIQVAMGWEGIHLYDFQLRAVRYGSRELSASSPDVTLAALRFRKGARFIYEYDLNIPWRHEVRIEDRLEPEAGKAYPACSGGSGACPPEDCAGPAAFMTRHDAVAGCCRRPWQHGRVHRRRCPGTPAGSPRRRRDKMATGTGRRAQPGARACSRAAVFTTHGKRAS